MVRRKTLTSPSTLGRERRQRVGQDRLRDLDERRLHGRVPDSRPRPPEDVGRAWRTPARGRCPAGRCEVAEVAPDHVARLDVVLGPAGRDRPGRAPRSARRRRARAMEWPGARARRSEPSVGGAPGRGQAARRLPVRARTSSPGAAVGRTGGQAGRDEASAGDRRARQEPATGQGRVSQERVVQVVLRLVSMRERYRGRAASLVM